MNSRRAGSVLPHNPVGHTLRALTRWAVAASLGAAACAQQNQQQLPASGSDAGTAGDNGDAGRAQNVDVLAGGAGSAAASGSAGTAAGSGGMSNVGLAGSGGMAGAGHAAAGGGGTSGAGDGFRSVTCTMDQRIDVFATPIMPARVVEHAAAFLSFSAGVGMAGPYPARVEAIGAFGQACSGASDSAACNQAVSMLSAPDAACEADKVCKPFVVTTQGDEARRIDSEQDLLNWLGSIDTPSEAVLAATFKGLRPACDRIYASSPVGPTSRGTMVQDQPDGYVVRSEWQECGKPELRETIEIARDGSSGELERVEIAPQNCSVGRRPAGLQPAASDAYERCSSDRAVGAYLAAAATLEAASVYAFEQLAGELTRHGAPAELVACAARAALEEVRHTQLMTAQAERYHTTPAAPQIVPPGPRSLFELALENAVEGCVRETFGALVACQQAAVARDPQLARVMSTIARDEASHAELAWHIAAWIEPQLEAGERAQLELARRAALAELHEAANAETTPDAALTLGYPSAALQHSTIDQLQDAFALA